MSRQVFADLPANSEKSHINHAIPEYIAVIGVFVNLNSLGSCPLQKLMPWWRKGYKKACTKANIEIGGEDSTTAPPALIDDTAKMKGLCTDERPEYRHV